MNVTMDAAGRIVLPKALRDAVGAEAGVALDAEVRDGAVILRPKPTPMKLLKTRGGVVAKPDHSLPPLTPDMVRAALESARR